MYLELRDAGEPLLRVPLSAAPILVGRSSECQLRHSSKHKTAKYVSGKHAEIQLQLLVRDLGSTNGTWIEGTRVESCHVAVNQAIQLGQEGELTIVAVDGQPESVSDDWDSDDTLVEPAADRDPAPPAPPLSAAEFELPVPGEVAPPSWEGTDDESSTDGVATAGGTEPPYEPLEEYEPLEPLEPVEPAATQGVPAPPPEVTPTQEVAPASAPSPDHQAQIDSLISQRDAVRAELLQVREQVLILEEEKEEQQLQLEKATLEGSGSEVSSSKEVTQESEAALRAAEERAEAASADAARAAEEISEARSAAAVQVAEIRAAAADEVSDAKAAMADELAAAKAEAAEAREAMAELEGKLTAERDAALAEAAALATVSPAPTDDDTVGLDDSVDDDTQTTGLTETPDESSTDVNAGPNNGTSDTLSDDETEAFEAPQKTLADSDDFDTVGLESDADDHPQVDIYGGDSDDTDDEDLDATIGDEEEDDEPADTVATQDDQPEEEDRYRQRGSHRVEARLKSHAAGDNGRDDAPPRDLAEERRVRKLLDEAGFDSVEDAITSAQKRLTRIEQLTEEVQPNSTASVHVLREFNQAGGELEDGLVGVAAKRTTLEADVGFTLGKLYDFSRRVEGYITRKSQGYGGDVDTDETILPGTDGSVSRSVNRLLVKGQERDREQLAAYLERLSTWLVVILMAEKSGTDRWLREELGKLAPICIEGAANISPFHEWFGRKGSQCWKEYCRLSEDFEWSVARQEIDRLTAEIALEMAERRGIRD